VCIFITESSGFEMQSQSENGLAKSLFRNILRLSPSLTIFYEAGKRLESSNSFEINILQEIV